MKFLVLGDFHYKKNMYASTLAHLDAVMERARQEKVDFVIHTGDFSNDYIGSSELLDAYLNNRHGLPVFGIYGNHELESSGNSMEFVTPRLCNRHVHFGRDRAGYWYFDQSGFRIIGLDTNYSFNVTAGEWQHNQTASWGAPSGNKSEGSLSPVQLEWLDETVSQACDQKLKVIVFSHAALSGQWYSSPDAKAARDIFHRYKDTVLMNINGHLHTDHFCVLDNIAYFDVNAVLNGAWYAEGEHHYDIHHTYIREVVSKNGKPEGCETARLRELTQGKNTWFFKDPLSAIVEVCSNGQITVKGSKSSWAHGIEPPWHNDAMKPEIPNRTVKIL